MDLSIQRALNDKLYDKRKIGALELERVIRELAANKDYDKIQKVIQQLCNDFAYAVHQPHARNGGLIGLAAAAISLGPDLARYLAEIVPPVLACFTDQDARVRYYACESMYNIAKVAKGEVLPYFNDIFDALCKLGADSELSVKNGAELLDRLVKDIVSESAASYVSILHAPESGAEDADKESPLSSVHMPMAFSLERFIPLLKERIFVLNPFTRTFLVGWITLLDSIPDLELVTYLPEFLGGLFRFLSDPNKDVHIATYGALERFLDEIKRISKVKKGIAESRKSRSRSDAGKRKRPDFTESENDGEGEELVADDTLDTDSVASEDEKETNSDDDWIPGQDAHIDYKSILKILTQNLDSQLEEDSLLESLRWILEFLEICPEEVLPFTPKILAHLLPAMASGIESIRVAAGRVNTSLMNYVVSLTDEESVPASLTGTRASLLASKESGESGRRDPSNAPRSSLSSSKEIEIKQTDATSLQDRAGTPAPSTTPSVDLDYASAVTSLTLLFLNDHEATRVAALTWLLMLHKKSPRKVVAFNDGIFPALLKMLSDPAEPVVTRDLQLLSQISRNSDDGYFSSFMVSLLQLFSTDRKLLETRGNLIIRQLCKNLSAERIYRSLADCIEKEEDIEFASIMVQILNNNLITAPELADLRKRLRNLETRDGQLFFVSIFRSWCYNSVATFSLCLLAQAYEQAYNLLQVFAELEMTVNMLIQIDKLVQLLESPVFTYLRLQLLEPEKFPHLYKCLYGLLMLLPQSAAFAALKNRLNSVSAIGYLHIAPRSYVPSPSSSISQTRNSSVADVASPFLTYRNSIPDNSHTPRNSTTASASSSTYDRPNRLKGRDEGIRWGELLDKFRSVQERARRAQRSSMDLDEGFTFPSDRNEMAQESKAYNNLVRLSGPPVPVKDSPTTASTTSLPKTSKIGLSKLSRLAGSSRLKK